ncbi:MAG: NADH-quinone oxidoreductase subunit M [Elusimicrobia bacterium]|nr:NADH-quinone oxidoreductase subunit M [Elusimicrobiota bacterium]
MLTWMLAIPLAGALVTLVLPNRRTLIRATAAIMSAIPLVISVWVACQFDQSTAAMQFLQRIPWIPGLHVDYAVGVDGLSLPLVVLTTLLSFLAIIGSFNIEERVKEYFFFFLLLEVGMLGVFVALDFFLFYIFWEVTLVPMYFLIGIWGGPQKEYAAIKFFLYTLLGSVVMLLGILGLYFASEPHTFDFLTLATQHGHFSMAFQMVVFLALYIGFAIKVPAFPFHTWLPLAHVEAPTAVSVILAGVLLKMGIYGLMRVSFPILPQATVAFAIPLAIIALINIVYGALVSLAQQDLKRMIAYSSINHMGYCLLGIASLTVTGFNGAVLQMVNHGIITGSLFLLVGVLYDRAHTRDMGAFGGLGAKVPVYAGIMTTASLASLGLPGLAGFVSEFLCLLGGFSAFRGITIAAVSGLVITAGFFLLMLKRIFLGPLNPRWNQLTDMDTRELCAVIPLVVLMVFLGVYPNAVLDVMNVTMSQLVQVVKGP